MLRKKKGSITIEAALIVPLVTAMLIVLIFFGILGYSRVIASVIINDTANKISSTWNSNSGEFSKYIESEGGNSSKARALYFSSDAEAAEGKVRDYLVGEIERSLPIKPTVSAEVKRSNYLIAESFHLEVSCIYSFPFESMFRFIGMENIINDKYNKGIVVSDSVGNMRTIKYAKGLVGRVMDNLEGSSVMTKIQEVMNKVKSKFNSAK